MRILGYQQLGSVAASTALTFPAGTQKIILNPQAQAIRFRSDGVAPTAAVGFPVAAGTNFELETSSLTAFRIIEQAASAVVNVLYLGE